ncbi:MAG: MerR family transcriptional regulator [Reyranellaceae bacterium]
MRDANITIVRSIMVEEQIFYQREAARAAGLNSGTLKTWRRRHLVDKAIGRQRQWVKYSFVDICSIRLTQTLSAAGIESVHWGAIVAAARPVFVAASKDIESWLVVVPGGDRALAFFVTDNAGVARAVSKSPVVYCIALQKIIAAVASALRAAQP